MSIDAIAIDGPAGAGKSTVAKRIAKKLGFSFLDTGAMYRCVARAASVARLDFADEPGVSALAESIEIRFEPGDPQKVFLNEEDVTQSIRTELVGHGASVVSTFPRVRAAMVNRQREICGLGKVVMEGRDTTTVVCPEAKLKVFLTASPLERARRRTQELLQSGQAADEAQILSQIIERDTRDSERAQSPLTVAPGAVVIDTDELSIDDVVDQIVELYHSSASA